MWRGYCCVSEQAQQPSGVTAPSASSLSTGAAPFKIAVIEMEAFYDPEKGITRLIRAIGSVDQEFEPLRKELRGMRQGYQGLADEIAKATSTTDSRALQENRFRAESMWRELRNKAEDAEQAFERRLQQILGPIEDDLQKAIAPYAEQRGISLVIDRAEARDVILYVAESANVTQDFIGEYNRRASSATPPAKPSGN
jgi:Skp family chaperone for outer membrane proteins